MNTPGQTRAILLVMISPLAIENQSKAKATNALARDRYQKTFGSAPTRDAPTMGTQIGIVSRAREAPTIVAATKDHNGMLDREDVLGARLCLVSMSVAPKMVLQLAAAYYLAVFEH